MHRVFPRFAKRRTAREKSFTLIDVLCCKRRSASDRMRGISVSMEELDRVLRAFHKGVVHVFAYEHRTHWDRAVREAFRGSDDVGDDTEVVSAERCSQSTEAR